MAHKPSLPDNFYVEIDINVDRYNASNLKLMSISSPIDIFYDLYLI